MEEVKLNKQKQSTKAPNDENNKPRRNANGKMKKKTFFFCFLSSASTSASTDSQRQTSKTHTNKTKYTIYVAIHFFHTTISTSNSSVPIKLNAIPPKKTEKTKNKKLRNNSIEKTPNQTPQDNSHLYSLYLYTRHTNTNTAVHTVHCAVAMHWRCMRLHIFDIV